MKSVNIAELKNRLSHYLNEVKAGREILVRDRSTAVAKLVPITHDSDDDEELSALAAKGKIRLGEGVLSESFWKLPAPRVSPSTLRRVLEDERDGR